MLLVAVGEKIGWLGWDLGCPAGKDAATGSRGPGPVKAVRDIQTGWHLVSGGDSGKKGHEAGTTWGHEAARKGQSPEGESQQQVKFRGSRQK